MSSDLAGMISASQDALIDAIDFSKLGRPTASYVGSKDGARAVPSAEVQHGWRDGDASDHRRRWVGGSSHGLHELRGA